MGTANWQPKWWTAEKHGSTWDKVKDAMQRDWEQPKADLGVKGAVDLNQDAGDTVRQAAGKEAIPPEDVPNSVGTLHGSDMAWKDAEEPFRYGYGARSEYGAQHTAWDDKLETRLRTDWEGDSTSEFHPKWEEIKAAVRRGWEQAKS